jgi:ABC-type bacteriocin/lantibiotic exporter with double-glycine peptidase domain
VLQILQLRITENIQQKIYVRYAFDFAFRFPRFDRKLLDKLVPSELMNRFFDIINLQKGISKVLLDFSAAILQILFSLFVLSFYHPFYIIFSIGLVITLIFLFKPIINRGFNTSLIESKYKYKTAYWLQEIAKTDWSFRLNPVGNHHLKKLDDLTQGYLSSREEHFKILWLQFSWMIAFKVIIVTSLLGIGGYLVIDQQMNLGQFVAAEVLIVLILGAFEKIIQLLDTLYDVFTSLEKIEQVRDIQMLNEEVNLKEDFDSSNFYPIELTAGNDSNRVILSLLKRDRVHVISTSDTETIQQLKSIIDPTISSKYIPRWNHEVPSNEKTKLAFCKIGWFSKQTHLFEGTIKENILLGYSDSMVQETLIWDALDMADLSNFVKSLPRGLDTAVGENGSNLSGGQRQRLGIARALLTKPKFVVLDEATSSLDGESEAAITETFLNLPGETTLITIAHRLSTVRNADKVVYMSNGAIQAVGPFDDE